MNRGDNRRKEEDPPENTDTNVVGMPDSIIALLDELRRKAGCEEITQIAFVASDIEGNLIADWDSSVNMADLCLLKGFFDVAVFKSLCEDQDE